jgi:hypothetical protein
MISVPPVSLSARLNPVLTNRITRELDRFGWCSYLLAVTPEKTISFGRPVVLWEKNGKLEFIPLGEHYFLPIGNPAEDIEIVNYAIGTSGAYARRFENAVVFVNPQSNPVTVPLTGKLNDIAVKLGKSTLELKTHDGMIVMTTPTNVGQNHINQANPFKVWSTNGKLWFEGIREGDSMKVYTSTGILQQNIVTMTEERGELDLPKGFYIVQSGNQADKVIIF